MAKSSNHLSNEPPKGMRDFLPSETGLRDLVIDRIISVYRSYGFERVETPAVEDIRRLMHGDGGENRNLVFKILKRGEKLNLNTNELQESDLVDLGLRFDLTVPLVRYYANNRPELPDPFKSIQIGPVWRAERPQKGRLRQFYQCDIDIIGGTCPRNEIEILHIAEKALSEIGFKELNFKINDRRLLSSCANFCGFEKDIHEPLFILLDKLDKVGLDGVKQQLLSGQFNTTSANNFIKLIEDYFNGSGEKLHTLGRKLGAKIDQTVIDDLGKTISTLQELFQERAQINFDLSLVRGMGYYTGQIFEVQLPEFSSVSCGGGGRYDNLIGKVSGQQTNACGFSIGFERIMSILEEHPEKVKNVSKEKIAFFYDPQSVDIKEILDITDPLRNRSKTVSILELPKKLSNKLNQLSKSGYTGFIKYVPNEKLEVKHINQI